jgi:hypothetical protein
MEGEFDVPLSVKKTDTIGIELGLTADRTFTREQLGKAYRDKYGGSPPRDVGRLLDEMFTRHVNFMNAIPGTTDGTNQQYYMTNYTSIAPLRKAYEAYLKNKGVESVRWIGDDGGGQSTRSASEESLLLFGGLDCRENH